MLGGRRRAPHATSRRIRRSAGADSCTSRAGEGETSGTAWSTRMRTEHASTRCPSIAGIIPAPTIRYRRFAPCARARLPAPCAPAPRASRFECSWQAGARRGLALWLMRTPYMTTGRQLRPDPRLDSASPRRQRVAGSRSRRRRDTCRGRHRATQDSRARKRGGCRRATRARAARQGAAAQPADLRLKGVCGRP